MENVLAFALLFFPIASFASIKVAMTIDDLPSHAEVPPSVTREEIAKKMIETLRAEGIGPVYGFINAEKSDSDSTLNEVLSLWAESGNRLGNHTYSHKSLNKTDVREFEIEIDRNESTLQKFASTTDWHFFRYPFLHEGNTLEN